MPGCVCGQCDHCRLLGAIAFAGGRVVDGDAEHLAWLLEAGGDHVDWFLSVVRRVFLYCGTPGPKPRPPPPPHHRWWKWRELGDSSSKMRALCYVRVSKDEQKPELQIDETGELVSRRGWSLTRTLVDDGISGSHGNRPAFRELLAAARRREFDVLVVYRTDRVFRSLRELLVTVEELGELGIGLVSVHEPFDTTTSSGRLLLHIVGAFAEFERNVLRERTRSGLAAAKRRGAKLGRPRRSLDLERVAQLRAQGKRLCDIAAELGISERTLHRRLPKTWSQPPSATD